MLHLVTITVVCLFVLLCTRVLMRRQAMLARNQRIIWRGIRLILKRLDPPDNEGFSILITGERRVGMADRLQFRLLLPAKAAADVVSRACTVTVGDSTTTHDLAADAASIDGLEGDEGAIVSATLIDTDNAGNPSPAREFGPVALADTFAPPQPGELGIEILGESHT